MLDKLNKLCYTNIVMSDTNEKTVGLFADLLKRNNTKIREDRAVAIVEDAEMHFKRTIEDMQLDLRRLNRERDNMLDLSPANADSLVLASDFSGKQFADKDIELGVKIRNVEIKLQVATERYTKLFGKVI
jgi:hypothetical protein